MLRPAISLSAAVLFALPCSAQSLNIDVGSVLGVPTNAYGAAASQPGAWNQMNDGFGTPLFDLAGGATGASISALGANFAFWSNNAGTFGDDEQLLDDACDGGRIYTISGLTPGDYTVYTYAWAPDTSAAFTNVDVVGSAYPPQDVGGSWTGSHQLGVTYALHDVSAPTGTITININVAVQYATVNGFQLVEGGSACPPPTTYCTAKPNSLGCPAVLSGVGIPSASAGTGFNVGYGPVPGGNVGLFVYSTNGAAASPISNAFGFLCVSTTGLFRTPPTPSGGTPGLCGGHYTINFNAFFATQTADPNLVAGATVDMQCWYRDPPNPGTANLSNAIAFLMCP